MFITGFITINILIDFYKIWKNKNIFWEESYKNDLIYGYSDLIKKDFKILGIKGILILIITLKVLKIILIIQIITTIYFLIKISFKKNIKINKRSFLIDIFINNSKIVAYLIHKNLKNLKIDLIMIEKIILNVNTILLWGYPRKVIDNSFFITKIILNLKKSPKKIKLRVLQNIYNNYFTDLIKKFENTL